MLTRCGIWCPCYLHSPSSEGGYLNLELGRKASTNLDNILKSRAITLPTKVHVVKAIVFPVVMYECESWTIKLSFEELVLLNYGFGEDS